MPKILDLCGGAGAWSKPYLDAGYRVFLATLPMFDVRDVELDRDSAHFIRKDDGNVETVSLPCDDVYGILAAPPCTEFSLAKNGAPTPRNLDAGMEIVRACMDIIWHFQTYGKLKFWALENPVGLLRRFLGRPRFTFRQWEFGDTGVKPTDIWGYFNEPKKTVSQMPENITKRYKSGKVNTLAWAAPKHPEYAHLHLDRAALRAITPAGFAQAFYRANR